LSASNLETENWKIETRPFFRFSIFDFPFSIFELPFFEFPALCDATIEPEAFPRQKFAPQMVGPSKLYARWSVEIKRSGILRAGERVAVAVSGGADSILLLDFMRQFSFETGVFVSVAHFNHHLRGSDSQADEEFVAGRAAELGLELFRAEADVLHVARSHRQNIEATARDLRYRFFFSLVNQHKLDKVATAHTANDQAETLLLRLMRGTGTRGLGAIYPVLDGKIVRPFLTLTRPEIESEVQSRRLEFRLDSSNSDPRFMRNRIRRTLLPLLATEFNPRIVTALSGLAGRCRQDEAFLQLVASERARSWRIQEANHERIALRPFIEFHPAIQRRVLRDMISSLHGSLRGITSTHIEALCCFAASSQSGKQLVLPGGLRARKEFEWLVIGRDEGTRPGYIFELAPPAAITVTQLGLKFRFLIAENPGSWVAQKGYNGGQVVALDLDRVRGKLVLRNWQSGDRFQPSGSRRAVKLKELFVRRKIPVSNRHLWPVLLSNEHIVWVHGFPAAEGCAASESSGCALIIQQERTP
jgi:tRNA(Ile)-lysidine synthase